MPISYRRSIGRDGGMMWATGDRRVVTVWRSSTCGRWWRMVKGARGTRQTRGQFGESAALRVLHEQGYDVLERNWRFGRGEVDIIAKDGTTYVFVEVKLRRNSRFGAPEEAVTPAKLTRLSEAAMRFLEQSHVPDADWRIDVVALEMERDVISAVRLIRGVGM